MANMPPQLSMLYIVTKHGHLECNINVDINICYSHSADLDGLFVREEVFNATSPLFECINVTHGSVASNTIGIEVWVSVL